MKNNCIALWNDEAGFIVSTELVLVATIAVIGLVVGLSEVAHAVGNELNDVGEAVGSINQSFCFGGMSVSGRNHCHSSKTGSIFVDHVDMCDLNECDISCYGPAPEAPKSFRN